MLSGETIYTCCGLYSIYRSSLLMCFANESIAFPTSILHKTKFIYFNKTKQKTGQSATQVDNPTTILNKTSHPQNYHKY